jgi:hypothetical protein
MDTLNNDPARAAKLLSLLADLLDLGVGFYAAFVDAADRVKLGRAEPTFHLAERLRDGMSTWADLLEGVVPSEVLPILRRAESREELVVALRKGATTLSADIPPMTLQLPNTDIEAKFLEALSGRLSEGMSVYGALLDVVCVLRLGFEEHVEHLNTQFKAGRYALSAVLDGVVSPGSLEVILAGEREGDLIGYLSHAAATLSANA